MSIIHEQMAAIQFHLRHIARLDSLAKTERFEHADSETVGMMLEQAARFTEESLQPLAMSGDVAGCSLSDGRVALPAGTPEAWSAWCGLGFPALTLPMEHDGLDFPRVAQCAVQELNDGANLSFGMLPINLRCAALALIKNAEPELVERYVPGLVSGELASTIAISEAQAGSDVGRILTAAEAAEDGSWLLTGTKIWISYADHNVTRDIVHLVLARVPNGEAGSRGLGLFLVPGLKDETGKQTNGITILRLEHKMGLHASPTCVLELHQSRGYLIGEPGRGLQALFVMMNAMRLAVGVQGAAVANAATLHAIRYALDRPQGGKPTERAIPIAEHADVRRMLLEMTAESELLRALTLRTAGCLDMAETTEDGARHDWQNLGELLLPLAKTLGAESAFAVANQGIQVLGGYGYTNEYPLERLARDIRVAAIYEGTSGIQALDFLKRRVRADKGDGLDKLIAAVREAAAVGSSPYSPHAGAVLQQLQDTAAHLTGAEAGSEAGAYALLQLTGLAVHVWNGHTLYCAASGNSGYEQRLRAALDWHAATVREKAALWARAATAPLPGFRFH